MEADSAWLERSAARELSLNIERGSIISAAQKSLGMVRDLVDDSSAQREQIEALSSSVAHLVGQDASGMGAVSTMQSVQESLGTLEDELTESSVRLHEIEARVSAAALNEPSAESIPERCARVSVMLEETAAAVDKAASDVELEELRTEVKRAKGVLEKLLPCVVAHQWSPSDPVTRNRERDLYGRIALSTGNVDDYNHDRGFTPLEWRTYLYRLGNSTSDLLEHLVSEGYAEMDQDASGRVSEQEFMHWVAAKKSSMEGKAFNHWFWALESSFVPTELAAVMEELAKQRSGDSQEVISMLKKEAEAASHTIGKTRRKLVSIQGSITQFEAMKGKLSKHDDTIRELQAKHQAGEGSSKTRALEKELSLKDNELQRCRKEAAEAAAKANRASEQLETLAAEYSQQMKQIEKSIDEMQLGELGELTKANIALQHELDDVKTENSRLLEKLEEEEKQRAGLAEEVKGLKGALAMAEGSVEEKEVTDHNPIAY